MQKFTFNDLGLLNGEMHGANRVHKLHRTKITCVNSNEKQK